MDELEQRLSSVLVRISGQAEPAVSRLRNPAEFPPQRRARFDSAGLYTGWKVAASAVAVVGVAASIAVAVPLLTEHPDRHLARHQVSTPAASTSLGTKDGVHPLWSLNLAKVPTLSFDQLPAGRVPAVPIPCTLDPAQVPDLASVPTLVTAAGTVRFNEPNTSAVLLLAQRRQGVFVVLTGAGAGHADQEGLFDARFVLVAPDNSRRELYHVAQAGEASVSPDGTILAVNTGQAVDLIEVSSGQVVHRLAGRFGQLTWASEHALLLTGKEGGATSLAWRAPWTGSAQPTAVRGTVALTVTGGIVAIDDSKGCLQRLNADATVTAVNCANWRAAGQVSPDGRYVPLQWLDQAGTVQRGVLDIQQDQVRPWPVAGINPSWLGAADVLLTQPGVVDQRIVAHCQLSTESCSTMPDKAQQGIWRGADWLGR